jgi:NADH-quinone oxidoreductase subunit H
MRYDQFMQFGWKVLIPVSLLWIMVVATLRLLSQQGTSRTGLLVFSGIVVAIVILISLAFDNAKQKKKNIPRPELSKPDFAVPELPNKGSNRV